MTAGEICRQLMYDRPIVALGYRFPGPPPVAQAEKQQTRVRRRDDHDLREASPELANIDAVAVESHTLPDQRAQREDDAGEVRGSIDIFEAN